MIPPSPESRELGRYVAIAQVGLEMAAPIGLGLVLDYYLHWSPWGVIGGAVFGLVAGVTHLITLANRQDAADSTKRQQGAS
jgi:F0F1-type ATP synthase assembly protein I